jgi:hypothetical protein
MSIFGKTLLFLLFFIACFYSYSVNAQQIPYSVAPSLLQYLDTAKAVNPRTLEEVFDEAIEAARPDTIRYWKRSARYNINFAQSEFRNWAGGGVNSIAIGALANLMATRDNGVSIWENSLDVAYGIVRQNKLHGFRKTDDNFILLSKYGRTLKNKWRVSTMLDARTQLRPGYRFERIPNSDEQRAIFISDFLSPGYFLLSLGTELSEANHYTVRVSPVTGKLTVVLDDSLSAAGAYGVKPGHTTRWEFGAQFNGMYRKEIMKNVTLQNRVMLFSAYDRYRTQPGFWKTLSTIDVFWESLSILKVNRYIDTSISTQLIWDRDINIVREDGRPPGPAVQFKGVLNIGLTLKL